MRSKRRVLWIFGIIAALFAVSLARGNVMADWRTASREPTGIAPDPAHHPEAIAQVYSARAYGWRGMFGVHTWIAVKRENAPRFTVYEVLGWRVYRGGEAVSVSYRSPDSRWFDSEPEIIADVRGDGVNEVIDQIEAAVKAYPHNNTYTVWPGPNSNTFTAFVARSVPALRVDLPPTAIGKDYLSDGLLAATPSGTGWTGFPERSSRCQSCCR